ncbi:alpha-mannosidase [Opitutaceae bacterium TAV1]|nr:alpha-mannosidase [Opitutaceae bacterium TAV1]
MSVDFDEITDDLIADLVLRVRDAVYRTVAPLEITAWRTAEPVTFANRVSGTQLALRPGDCRGWGKNLFDCAWMRFRAVVLPEHAGAELVARIDINGELCLVDEAGTPVRGLTCVKSTFDPRLGGPGKTTWRLPPGVVRAGGAVEFWGDAAFNDLFGAVKDGGRIALAELATCREDVRQLYYDLETLRDWLATLPAASDEARRLRGDFAALATDWPAGGETPDADGVERARARLRPWFDAAANANTKPALVVHGIGHAHLDLAWLWPIRETIRKGARTFATALYNLERYPEYVFGFSQPQLYAWLKEHYPELYSKIRDAVRAGRIEAQGTFWVEPDCNMPSGEAFVRQILAGARFFREEFCTESDVCWEPDVFGYHGQLPQILKKSGHRYFMTQKLSWNVVNRFGHHSFHWEGIDGTRLLTHMLPEETYNGPAAPRSLRKIADEYAERAVSDHALMAFGIGDGGGGPDAEHLERLRRAPALPGLPAVRIEKAEAFFETWSRDAEKFPVWRGELYLERHQGTLTTQARVKRNNRRAEIALREAEWAAYLASRYAGAAWPAAALDRLWKEVLLYQFHDILPGSSIRRVYTECHARYEAILGELAEMTRRHYAVVAAAQAAGETRVVAFNSLSWPRDEWLSLGGEWRRVRVPALGMAVIDTAPGAGAETEGVAAPVIADGDRLENENLAVTFAADGAIASIRDKRAGGREVLAAGEAGNDFVVIADTGDAWDFETDHEKKDVWGYLRRRLARPVLRESATFTDGPCAVRTQVWTVGKSEIRQTIRLFAGAEQIVFETEADWRDKATMLRVRFPVAVTADEASFEIPFGHICRSTREDTLAQRAQIEVAALQWVDLSEAGYGVALLNDCKHGFRVKGHTIDMCLLRSVPHPGTALIGKDDVSADGGDGMDYTDLETHVFRYALRPHAGGCDAAALTAAARAFNTPLAVIGDLEGAAVSGPLRRREASPGSGDSRLATAKGEARGASSQRQVPRPKADSLPCRRSGHAGGTSAPLVCDSPAIELAAIKRAEDGRGWVLRLVNVTGDDVTTWLAAPDDAAAGSWEECDLSEKPLAAATSRSGAEGRVPLAFARFEIKTLRWTP